MKPMPECVVYTQEPLLLTRMRGLLALQAQIRHIEVPGELVDWTIRHPESVVLLDARGHHYDDLVKELLRQKDAPVLIVSGVARSEPLRFAESMGVYAVVSLEPELHPFKTLMRHAFEHAVLARQNRHLKDELAKAQMLRSAHQQQRPPRPSMLPLQNFSRTLKNFDDISQLYRSVMDSFVESAKVTRAGLFCSIGGGGYCFRAGVRCLSATQELSFSDRDRFVHWLNRHGFLVSRETVRNLSDPVDRDMLQRHLELFGAELIIPIHSGEMVSGWIFVGQRITGIPFEYEDLEVLTAYADHIANTLSNALKHQQTSLQKVLAETMLHVIPFGLVAIGADGAIRWMNQEAMSVFECGLKEMNGMPVELLSSQVADVLRRALGGEEVCAPVEWRDPATRRLVSLESRRLVSESAECVGAVALIKNITSQRLFAEKEDQLERTAFWTELAASMSHEIRNPLVAIKTFAQLLPERFGDDEFRRDFRRNVVSDVDRLNGLVDQIHQFAHPPELDFSPIKIHGVIEHAVSEAKKQVAQDILFSVQVDERVPRVEGDARALGESLIHLLLNCGEALEGVSAPKVDIHVDTRREAEGQQVLRIRIRDNGCGMSLDSIEQAFSPFYTTKARGMGLGLPIVKRTALDHNGVVDLSSAGQGMLVTMHLPLQAKPFG